MGSASPPRGFRGLAGIVGPGIVVAATGVGAGDLVAAAKAGAAHGMPVLWTAAVGAVLKFALAEGVARWQLATGRTVLEGWAARLGVAVQAIFLAYLALWSLIVQGFEAVVAIDTRGRDLHKRVRTASKRSLLELIP